MIGTAFDLLYIEKDRETLKKLWKQSRLLCLLTISLASCDAQPYHETEIEFRNPHDGVKLAGTLTIPNSPGGHPAILLIPGGGQMNRDEECFGHRPFKVLADYLAQRGIMSLRVDRRGCGRSEGTQAEFNVGDLVADAQAGIACLRNHAGTDTDHIGVLGHSLGAIIAPMVANRSPDVKFCILLASPGTWGKEFFCMQAQAIARAAGFGDRECDTIRPLYDRLFPLLIKDNLSLKEEKLARRLMEELLKFEDRETRELVGDVDAASKLEVLRSKGAREFLTFDPGAELRRLRCPVLVLNGDRDIQVPSKGNLPLIEKALRSGKNTNYKIVELPGMNHMFQECQTGRIPEYGRLKQTMSPKALDLIGDWIVDVSGMRR
jgi:pimeloyl-ACP methyl ester carboxylesterase